MPILKKALIRDSSVPVGQAAPVHVDCDCGEQVVIGPRGGECSKCGTTYSASGWITYQRPPMQEEPEDEGEAPERDSAEPALLAETPEEAQRMTYTGRSWPALKESKRFDTERLASSPLFERRLF